MAMHAYNLSTWETAQKMKNSRLDWDRFQNQNFWLAIDGSVDKVVVIQM